MADSGFLLKLGQALPPEISLDALRKNYPSQLWESMPRLAAISAFASGVLDIEDYLERYPDVKKTGLDPVAHYVDYGIYEQRAVRFRKNLSSTPEADYIVSLTSYPARIDKCHIAIESILAQKVKNKHVILWLAREEFPEGEETLPQSLLDLRSPEFHIEWCDNLYSYKKLIPALRKYPDKAIITADDDIIYPYDWLTSLLAANAANPNAIHAHRCRVIGVNTDGTLTKYNSWQVNPEMEVDNNLLFPNCGAGTIYPPHSLHPDTLNDDLFLNLCRYGDDIWFWAMARLNNTPIRNIRSDTDWKNLKYVDGTQEVGLWKENANGRNEQMFAAILRQYPTLLERQRSSAPRLLNIANKTTLRDRPANVSVIIPVYNTSAYLRKCLENITNQRNISQEIFVINDGSTDDSAEVIDCFQKRDSRIMVITKVNEGQGKARNLALELAKGEFVYFMDSDDYIELDTLEILYNAAKKHHLDIISPKIPEHYFKKNLDFIACIPNKAQFIKKSIIDDYHIIQPNSRSGQDGVFAHLCLTHCERIGIAYNAKHFYTTRAAGTSSIYASSKHDEVFPLLQSHYEHITAHYDAYSLWQSQSLRLLVFIIEESVKNRIEKHIQFMSDECSTNCFGLLRNIAQKCLPCLDARQTAYIPEFIHTLMSTNPEDMAAIYRSKYYQKIPTLSFPSNENLLAKDNVYICKLSKEALTRSEQQKAVQQADKDRKDAVGAIPRSLEKKLDYLINHITNTGSDILAELRQPCSSLKNGEQSLVVSLTTLPHRLHSVYLAIESIFNQFLLPSRIILWLPDSIQKNAIPVRLNNLQSRGLEIRFIRDVGPHSKLLYALKSMPDKNIVTIDDDIIYPRNMLSTLFSYHKKFPHAVIANWARELAFDKSGQVLPVREGRLLVNFYENDMEPNVKYEAEPSMRAFAYGTSGILYPPGSINNMVFDVPKFQKLCPKEDDIWFKAMEILNGTPVVVTDLGMKSIHRILPGSQTEALRYYNHGEHQNISQLRGVFDQLGLYNHL